MTALSILGFVYVFVDDSGDAGFKFDQGSSAHIVMSAVVLRNREDAEHAMRVVQGARCYVGADGQEHINENEFKYAKCKVAIKDRFFEKLRDARFDLRVIMLDKRQLYSSHLRENPNDLKSYLIRQLLTHTLGTVRDAQLIIDGQDQQSFRMSDRDYFMRMVNREVPGTLSGVQFRDSKKSQLIQVADMTAGAMRRALLDDRDARRHVNTLTNRFQYPAGSRWMFRAK